MTALEPTLSKIPEKRKMTARFARGIPTPAARRLMAASKARKIFIFLLERAQKFSSNELNFAGFASLLTQGRAASHPLRAKIHFPTPPFLFARLLADGADFLAGYLFMSPLPHTTRARATKGTP